MKHGRPQARIDPSAPRWRTTIADLEPGQRAWTTLSALRTDADGTAWIYPGYPAVRTMPVPPMRTIDVARASDGWEVDVRSAEGYAFRPGPLRRLIARVLGWSKAAPEPVVLVERGSAVIAGMRQHEWRARVDAQHVAAEMPDKAQLDGCDRQP